MSTLVASLPDATIWFPGLPVLLEAVPVPALALVELSLLLVVGRAIGDLLGLKHWGLPEALLAGVLGMLAVTQGPIDLVPQPVIDLWANLPEALLTIVFGTLLLGKSLPNPLGLWRPVSAQMLLALTLGFGQYVVGGLTVLLLLGPWLGVNPLMACLIEAAYEGGHGSAAAMGSHYAQLGFVAGPSLGLALSTVGLLLSTVVGVVLVVLARGQGLLHPEPAHRPRSLTTPATVSISPGSQGPEQELGLTAWGVNLALVGMAVALGLGLMTLLRSGAQGLGDSAGNVLDAIPVFPLALAGSLMVRLVLDGCGRGEWASKRLQGRLGTVAADLLITAAIASLDLNLLRQDWLPMVILALVGLAWNLSVVLLLAPRILPASWFERAITEFGQATGVVASGLLLLRMVDPLDRSDSLTPFSIKQLMLQPILAGGLVTVLAPLAINRWGLTAWTLVCLALVVLWVGLGLALAGRDLSAPSPPRCLHRP